MKMEKIISGNKIKNVLGGRKGYFDGKVYDLEISKIKSISYKLYTTLWFNTLRISTEKEDNIWGPFLLPWHYKKVAAEIKKINPRVVDYGIDYSIIVLMAVFFIASFIFISAMKIFGVI